MLEDFWVMQPNSEGVIQRELPCWSPLPVGIIEVNVDATFSSKIGVANLEVVARDTSGSVCFCAISKINKVGSPLHAEARAILFGLEVARESIFNSIIFENGSEVHNIYRIGSGAVLF
ncbi:hypothetical protein REPUB_Repub07fG0110400 [Reevesia pubescens]